MRKRPSLLQKSSVSVRTGEMIQISTYQMTLQALFEVMSRSALSLWFLTASALTVGVCL